MAAPGLCMAPPRRYDLDVETLGAPVSVPRARSRWWMWCAVMLATVVGATGFAIVDQAPDAGGGTDVEALLPPDGAAWEVVDEQYGSFGVEASRFTGYGDLFDLPDLVSLGIADAVVTGGGDVLTARFYREIWTPLDSVVASDEAAPPTSTQITATYWLADDGIRLASISGGASGFVYSPPLLVIPAGAAPGSSWSSAGDALPGGILEYSSTGSAAENEPGCLEITLETTLTDPSVGDATSAQVSSSREVAVWCTGAGSLASASLINGVESTATTRQVGAGETSTEGAAAPSLVSVPWPSPAGEWATHQVPLATVDPFFGDTEQFLVTSPMGASTASGVSVVASGRDVVGVAVAGDRVERAFVGHPGGDIIQISAIGDLIVVATSERMLVAYDDRGLRRWSAEFGDIVLSPVVGGVDSSIIAVALDGEVRRLDAANGAAIWSTPLGVDSAVAPAVADDRVIVGGRDGSITSIAITNGEIQWTSSMASPLEMAAAVDHLLVLTNDGTLVCLDAPTGDREWIRTTDGANALAVIAETAVVHSSLGLESFSLDGERGWRIQIPVEASIDQIANIGDAVAMLTDSTVTVVDPDGFAALKATLPPDFTASRTLMMPTIDGVLLVSGNGEFLLIGPPR